MKSFFLRRTTSPTWMFIHFDSWNLKRRQNSSVLVLEPATQWSRTSFCLTCPPAEPRTSCCWSPCPFGGVPSGKTNEEDLHHVRSTTSWTTLLVLVLKPTGLSVKFIIFTNSVQHCSLSNDGHELFMGLKSLFKQKGTYQIVHQVFDGSDSQHDDQRNQGGVPRQSGNVWNDLQ